VWANNDASRRIMTGFDRLLLEIGFESGLGKPRAKETGAALTCPECLVGMQKVRMESAACSIDACPAHGSWFDPGELEDVMRAFRRAREAGVPMRQGMRPKTSTLVDLVEQSFEDPV